MVGAEFFVLFVSFAWLSVRCRGAPPQEQLCYAPLCDLRIAFVISNEDAVEFFFDDGEEPLGECMVTRRPLPHLGDAQQVVCGSLVPTPTLFAEAVGDSVMALRDRYTHPREGLGDSIYVARLEDGGQSVFIGMHGHRQEFGLITLTRRPSFEGLVGIQDPPNGALLTGRHGVRIVLENAKGMVRRGSQFVVNVEGVMRYQGSFPDNFLETKAVEPATWVVNVTPFSATGEPGYTTRRIFDVIITPAELHSARHFRDLSGDPENGVHSAHRPIDANAATGTTGEVGSDQDDLTNSHEQMHLCVWGNDHMDGQKSIWLDQIQGMDNQAYRWTWVLAGASHAYDDVHDKSADISTGSSVDNYEKGQALSILQRVASDNPDGVAARLVQNALANVDVRFSPLDAMPLRFDYELRQRPLFANGTYGKSFMEKVVEFEGRRNHHGAKQHMSTKEYLPDAYMFEIWQDIFGVGHPGQTLESLEALEPRWVREMFRNMAVFVKHDCKCDMVIFGNNRASQADVLLVEASRVVGVPSVMELLSAFPDTSTLPDAVIAPSISALQHSSVAHLRHRITTETVVISPGVVPELLADDSGSCRDRTIAGSNCRNTPSNGSFVVAIAGRISPEKSPGLFITAAHAILSTRPELQDRVKFIVIGDGPLLPAMKDLSAWLGLVQHVEWLGWQDRTGLRKQLQRVDVLVTLSMRAHSETFCIMNTEAMALGATVVTFAVGGQGEYVSGRVLPGYEAVGFVEPMEQVVELSQTEASGSVTGETVHQKLFYPTMNAVLVNEASPGAVSAAIIWAYDHPEARETIGRNARATIRSRFTTDRQMQQYDTFYRQIHRRILKKNASS